MLLTVLALSFLPPIQLQSPTHRRLAPYSLDPVSGTDKDGGSSVQPLVAPGTPAPWPRDAILDDSIPLPVAAVMESTPDGDAVRSPASGDPFFLGFVAGSHHPPANERVDPRLYDAALPSFDDGRPGAETYGFVMFSKRMTPERLAILEGLGARALGYHPHYTQKVALPVTAIDAVAGLPFVRWVGTAQPWQKVQPQLADAVAAAAPTQPVEVWVNVFESDLGPSSARQQGPAPTAVDPGGAVGTGDARELGDVWTSGGWQQRALEAAGLEISSYSERIRAFRARLMPTGLDLVADLDFVQFVELAPTAELDHDETAPMINADDARSLYGGGLNQIALAGMVDTGLEFDHLDFNHNVIGWDLSGAGNAWDDACGHGTHVGGSILGLGTVEPGHAGVAPGLGWGGTGRFFNVRLTASCTLLSPSVPTILSIVGTSQSWGGETTPMPHVINNAWGTPGNAAAPWVGTEADARLYDDHVWAAAQMHVFSAGNQGPTLRTIGLQPSAKNVFTVGSVIDYRDGVVGEPGTVSTSSSRGRTGDWRWKPNVMAPGRWVTSTDAFDTTGYVDMAGTSMAAAQVTGVVANVIDRLSWTYLPERIAAQLMATAHRKDGAVISTPSPAHLGVYGAGRVDATRAMWSGGGAVWTSWAFGLNAGQSNFADFTVPSGATRLVAVMHYVEDDASAGASAALVNDWDLWLDEAPFTPGTNTGEWFNQQNSLNNTEIRTLEGPNPGLWRWKVHPKSTTSIGYFGLTIVVETNDTTPTLTPLLYADQTCVVPGQEVEFDYLLWSQFGTASGVFLEVVQNGPTMAEAGTVLKGGVLTDLTDNVHIGWRLMLGNADPYFNRSAKWRASWPTSGVKTFYVQSFSDNAENDGVLVSVDVTVDGIPPTDPTNVVSTTHAPNAPMSCDTNITVQWDPSTDTLSGLAGYATQWDHNPFGEAGYTVTTTATSETTTLASAVPVWYFHVRALDKAGNASNSVSAGPFWIESSPVQTYCQAKTNSQGCVPYIQGVGSPSTAGFTVEAHDVVNNKAGLLFWGTASSFNPFQGGFKCVANPVVRTPVQNSGGNPPPDDCSGTYSWTFDPAYMAFKGIAPGAQIYCQFWSRDPSAPFTTGLTDGLYFVVCP